MQDYINSLNERQKEAAMLIDGPVMVFAGAGTGKTRTLTTRVAYMLDSGIPANNILAITFTNKATNEMRERLQKLVGAKSHNLTISTFHSLCAHILRRDIVHLNYDRHFEIIDDEDQLKIVSEAIDNLRLDKKKITPKHCKKEINNCKCFDIKLESYEAKVFNEYQRLMKEYNLLDFEDLLIKTNELFTTCPDVLEKYRKIYNYVLVDEFQDTNLIQYKIVSMLCKNSRKLFVVGDDDQSIYSFRGTNYENMKLFKKDFPETKIILLEENYRSTQEILKGTNNLISNNDDRENKKLFSSREGSKDDVVITQLSGDREEVEYVITNINSLVNKGYKYSDIAILYRNTVVSRNFELAMVQNAIPYRIFGGISYLRRREIKDISAYLKLIMNHNDVNSFKRIVNAPARSIGKTTLDRLLEYKLETKKNLFDSIRDIDTIPQNKKKALTDFVEMINELDKKLDDTPLDTYFDELLKRTNYLEVIKDDEDEEERLENIKEFKSILVSVEDNGEIASRREKLMSAFDEAILADDKLQNQRQRQDGVTLSTVHSVKGLEFRCVFVVAFEAGLFPNMSYFMDVDIEEERRIAYVACTRAKDKLFLTCAKSRLLYGKKINNPQSQFLIEFIGVKGSEAIKSGSYRKQSSLDYEYGISQVEDDYNPFNQIEKKYEKDTESTDTSGELTDDKTFKVGDFVNHAVYGDGIIVSLEAKTDMGWLGKICFTAQGTIKTFDMMHKSIKKKVR